jgi:hypothetical protein
MTFDNAVEGLETQKEFYGHLATELIDNCFDGIAHRQRENNNEEIPDSAVTNRLTGQPPCGLSIHLTPKRRKRKNQMGQYTRAPFQGLCAVCGQKNNLPVQRLQRQSNWQRHWLVMSYVDG